MASGCEVFVRWWGAWWAPGTPCHE